MQRAMSMVEGADPRNLGVEVQAHVFRWGGEVEQRILKWFPIGVYGPSRTDRAFQRVVLMAKVDVTSGDVYGFQLAEK